MQKPQIIAATVLIVAALGFSAVYAWQQAQNNSNDTGDQSSSASTSPTPTQMATSPGNQNESADQPAEPVEQSVNLYFVAIDDQGQGGAEIGCGDSLIPVSKRLTTATPLSDAVKALLEVKDEHYGQSGLYNALWQSDIQFESAAIDNGKATVHLSGNLKLSGSCDNPRVEEQLEATITQFDLVHSATILLNGQPLSDSLSGR